MKIYIFLMLIGFSLFGLAAFLNSLNLDENIGLGICFLLIAIIPMIILFIDGYVHRGDK
tara:strand:- start:236 stop:412 length:177 start_codon:yes stop_codon:yes gene_type:complete